jgi:hypothetical protein
MSLLTWLKKRKAERVLREYGVCPKHFMDLKKNRFGGYSDWCSDCYDENANNRNTAKQAAIAKLRALKGTDGRGHESRTVSAEQES